MAMIKTGLCAKDTAASTRSLTSKASSSKVIDFAKSRGDVAAVGCEVEVDEELLSVYPVLPPYVALFEPNEEHIWSKPGQMRAIFLNQPLKQWEQDAILKFSELLRKEFGLQPDEQLPRFIVPHLSRLLQQCKYKPDQAVKAYRALLIHRVDFLPMTLGDVQEVMMSGLVYWHGRDVYCRPLLTIRIGRVAPLLGRTEDIQKLFVFTMEYALRYLLIPGRVECWSVIIDCDGVSKLPSLMRCKSFGQTIATTLGKVYSGRMAWTKIFNFPSGFAYTAVRRMVQGIVSALGKADKVQFVRENVAESLKGYVEVGQLEKWAGGLAPDMEAKEVFPPRMFADPKGYGAKAEIDESLHGRTDIAFHEGFLWADCLERQTHWKEAAAALPLPPGAAEAAGVKPCQKIEAWRDIMAKWSKEEAELEKLSEVLPLAMTPANTLCETPANALDQALTSIPEGEAPLIEGLEDSPVQKPCALDKNEVEDEKLPNEARCKLPFCCSG